VRDGEIQALDMGLLRDRVQRSAERVWANWSATDVFGRKADELSPSSFPIID
jgi:hypothetical protein